MLQTNNSYSTSVSISLTWARCLSNRATALLLAAVASLACCAAFSAATVKTLAAAIALLALPLNAGTDWPSAAYCSIIIVVCDSECNTCCVELVRICMEQKFAVAVHSRCVLRSNHITDICTLSMPAHEADTRRSQSGLS
jgi:hypothetical protein